MDCCARQAIEQQFDQAKIDSELRRYRKRGPHPATRLLLAMLQPMAITGESLLDIGGGLGAIHHALLDSGVERAVEVDISDAALAAAAEEAARLHHADRVRFVHGDFIDVAPDLDAADVVTIDRVICCYPDMERLVSLSAEKAKRLYAAVYPRMRWWTRVGLSVINTMQRVRGSRFRLYHHSPDAIAAVLATQGFVASANLHTFVWDVAVYRRTSG